MANQPEWLNAYSRPASAQPTVQERKAGADIGQSEASAASSRASAASSAATAERTRQLTPVQVRKETALATKAELDAEKLRLAMEKARAQLSGRPAPADLEDARRQVLTELEGAIEAKRLSREMFGGSGLGHSLTAGLSGSPAATVSSLLKPIQANTAFNKLQEMRSKSPTGGALGAVSDKELQLLYSSEAAIDPTASDEVFQKGLDTIIGNRIAMLSRLGANPYEIAAMIPAEDLPTYKDSFKAYRFVPDDVKKISAYVEQSRKAGTFDPTDYAALVGEAYYNATGQQPDEAFIRNAAETGVNLANDPNAKLQDFDYTPADTEVQKNILGTSGKQTEETLGGVIGGAAINFVPSVFELAADTVKALTVDLPDTIEGIAKVVGGAAGISDPAAYEALKQYYTDRYGSAQGFAKAVRTDPASILADVAGVATGGATLAAKGLSLSGKVSKIAALSDAAKVAEGFGQVAAKVDPLKIAGDATQAGLRAGQKVAETVGVEIPARVAGVTGTDVKQAFTAGKEGSQPFLEQMRGTGDVMDPLAKADAAVSELYQARSRDYTRRMGKMDKTEVLDWADVEDAISKVEAVGKHKGIDISSASDVWQEVFDLADQFKAKGLNTIEDFDAMKRAVRNVGAKYQVGTPQHKVAKDVASAINDTIVQKAPVYANIMKDYRLASDTLSDIKASISLDAKSADTALGKLQRTAAGKGPRGTTVLNLLEQTKSGKGLGNMLAGQNLSATEAKGFVPSLSAPAALAAGDPTVLSTALVTPRGLGEKAYSLGEKYGVVERGAQALRGTQPVQRAEELVGKYLPTAAVATRIANPVIQAQVDPFQAPAAIVPEQVLAEMRKRYGMPSPQPMLRTPGRVSLDQLSAGYSNPGVSLRGITLPEDVPVEEVSEEEIVQGYRRGGLVAAPMFGR